MPREALMSSDRTNDSQRLNVARSENDSPGLNIIPRKTTEQASSDHQKGALRAAQQHTINSLGEFIFGLT
jgi:hypothetical protein